MSMATQIRNFILAALVLCLVVGVLDVLLAHLFSRAINTGASGLAPGTRRGGPATLFLLAGGVGGFVLTYIKAHFIDSIGLVIDAPIAILAGAISFGVGFGLCIGVPIDIPVESAAGHCFLSGAALAIVYGIKVWRDG